MEADTTDQTVKRLFALVGQAVARATTALLERDGPLGQVVVNDDRDIDTVTAQVESSLWSRIEQRTSRPSELRRDVCILLVLPELERSADLAAHIAQRALTDLGAHMSARSRGIVQRMSEIALDMWGAAAVVYDRGSATAIEIDEVDEELDVLHERLTDEVAAGTMTPAVVAQVTLLSRFYGRLGDHAVNIARRIDALANLESAADTDPPSEKSAEG